ncbi:unnamed protein product [Mytilus edulis]|uniref:Uncharacterized protein n=1 Tax=Mytilus edulis TaxID=6550 RepID=A0A8S3SQB2_MYTED|nr:unnamed protein product [Mytilus edulis]
MYCQNEPPPMVLPDEERSVGLVDRNVDQHYLSTVPTLYEEGNYHPGKTTWVDRAKKAGINVKNNDEECIKWAILWALHHDEVDPKQTDRVTQYHRWQKELNLVSLKDINKFEKANSTVAVNVFGHMTVTTGERTTAGSKICPGWCRTRFRTTMERFTCATGA